jgi:hypothetical protein
MNILTNDIVIFAVAFCLIVSFLIWLDTFLKKKVKNFKSFSSKKEIKIDTSRKLKGSPRRHK